MRNYFAIEGTDLVFTEAEWNKARNSPFNSGYGNRVIKLGQHKNREAARDYYIRKELYPWKAGKK